jgi:hypothetical protein
MACCVSIFRGHVKASVQMFSRNVEIFRRDFSNLESIGEVKNNVEDVERSPRDEEGQGDQHQHEVGPLSPLHLPRPPTDKK